MLRLTKSGKRKYVSLGISVKEKDWDFKKNQPKKSCPDNRIRYIRKKTGKEISFPLSDVGKEIIRKYSKPDATNEDYIFPILDRKIHRTEMQRKNRIHKVIGKVNPCLAEIGRMAGLETHLTTYVARHTFATVLKRSGVNIAIISESMGHSDIVTTQIYLDSFENSQIDEAMKNLL